jgi:protein-tyrosine phosphatase
MFDLHCHILPGIDDGPATIDGSLALARLAVERGVQTIVATPHVSHYYDNDAATIARLTDEVNGALRDAHIPLTVLAGAEIALTRASELASEELGALTLAGGPWVLLEPPFTSTATGIELAVGELAEQGYGILLAHPERCPAFQRDPRQLESLVRGGALTSITAGSLVGRFGASVKRFALELFEAELVHNVASDAHDVEQRQPGIANELEQAGLSAMREWLTDAVPRALLNGEESMPERPAFSFLATPSHGGSWWRRGPFRRAS